MRRLKNLQNQHPLVQNENRMDTLQDLAGYAILGYLCLEDKTSDVLPVIKYHDQDHQY